MQANVARKSSFSYLRIAASAAVVLLHTCSTLLDNPDMFFLSAQEKLFFTGVKNMMAWAVPCFFMLSGALLLDKNKEITIRDCLCKYSKRILLALIVFGMPFSFLIDFFNARRLSLSMISNAFLNLLTDNSFAHLWYLYALIGLYLLLPALKLFLRHCSAELLRYVLTLLFLFSFIIPDINRIFGLNIAFTLPGSSYYLFYFLLGYFLTYEKPLWMYRSVWCSAGIVGFCFAVCAASANQHIWANVPYDCSITAVGSLCIFSLFGKRSNVSTTKLWETDRCCFGVYLIHPLFIHFFYKALKITPLGDLFFLKTPLFAAVFIVLSFAAAGLMRKIPPLRKHIL